MPEYFCVSFFVAKNNKNWNEMKRVFNDELGISSGKSYVKESDFSILRKRNIALFFYDDEGTDYIEVLLGFPYQLFHKESFDKEIESLYRFVDFCFGLSGAILYVLCSYECNEYFLRDVDFLEDMDVKVISRFPITFVNKATKIDLLPTKELKYSNLFINHKAQDIFSVM